MQESTQGSPQVQAEPTKTGNTQATGVIPSGKEAPQGNPVTEAAKEAARKLKFKGDNGEDVEVDEDEVLKTYKERKKHQAAASKELNEGRAARMQAIKFMEAMKDKGQLFELVKKMGHDPRKLAEEYLTQALELETMDPKERENKELREKLTAREEADKKAEEAKQKEAFESTKKQLMEQYTSEIVEALKTSGVKQTKESVSKMAYYMARASKIKFDLTPMEAAKLVKQDDESSDFGSMKNMEAEEIVKRMGDEWVNKIRAYDIAKLKNPEAGLKTPQPTEQGKPREPKTSSKRMTPAEWRAFNRR